jgi:FHS family L-fucose permease-like MFS transporter
MAVGAIADRFGLSAAFAVPLAGYVFIAMFALAARESAVTVATQADPATSAPPIS